MLSQGHRSLQTRRYIGRINTRQCASSSCPSPNTTTTLRMTISPADTVTATLLYFSPPADGSKPHTYINVEPSRPQRNWEKVPHQVRIENIRGREGSVSLDATGFQYFRRAATHTAFDNDEAVEREYYSESIALVKELTGASRVVVFDHSESSDLRSLRPPSRSHLTPPAAIRRRRPGDPEDNPQKRKPVAQVHIDQTPTSAAARVRRHLPAADADAILSAGTRFQIINLWRPISRPAWDWPLALCDGRSVDATADLVPTTLKYPDRDGETFSVKFNEGHKWKYLRGMEPDELVLIKW